MRERAEEQYAQLLCQYRQSDRVKELEADLEIEKYENKKLKQTIDQMKKKIEQRIPVIESSEERRVELESIV